MQGAALVTWLHVPGSSGTVGSELKELLFQNCTFDRPEFLIINAACKAICPSGEGPRDINGNEWGGSWSVKLFFRDKDDEWLADDIEHAIADQVSPCDTHRSSLHGM